MTAAARPPDSALRPVPEDEWILRLVHPNHWEADAADGEHLTTACFSTADFKPTTASYGASVYVESQLAGGITELEAARPAWKKYGVVRVQVRELKPLNIRVCFTPMDCDVQGLEDAHASFIGIDDRGKRGLLLGILQARVHRPPAP